MVLKSKTVLLQSSKVKALCSLHIQHIKLKHNCCGFWGAWSTQAQKYEIRLPIDLMPPFREAEDDQYFFPLAYTNNTNPLLLHSSFSSFQLLKVSLKLPTKQMSYLWCHLISLNIQRNGGHLVGRACGENTWSERFIFGGNSTYIISSTTYQPKTL